MGFEPPDDCTQHVVFQGLRDRCLRLENDGCRQPDVFRVRCRAVGVEHLVGEVEQAVESVCYQLSITCHSQRDADQES